jgi:hypothetical protein
MALGVALRLEKERQRERACIYIETEIETERGSATFVEEKCHRTMIIYSSAECSNAVAAASRRRRQRSGHRPGLKLDLELLQTQMAQEPALRAKVYARKLRASLSMKRAEVGGAWASSGVEGNRMGFYVF